MIGSVRGITWITALVLALGLSLAGAAIDMQLSDGPGRIFQGAYLVGCVAAIGAVRRSNLFGPMVQPPLIHAVVIPGVVLLFAGLPGDSDTLSQVIAVGRPLIDGFPIMAITTLAVLLIGIGRVLVQRAPDRKKPVKSRPTSTGGKQSQRPPRDERERRGQGGTGYSDQAAGPARKGRGNQPRPQPEERDMGARDTGQRDAPSPSREPRGALRDTRGPRPWEAESRSARENAPDEAEARAETFPEAPTRRQPQSGRQSGPGGESLGRQPDAGQTPPPRGLPRDEESSQQPRRPWES